jgi:hypothetical protein
LHQKQGLLPETPSIEYECLGDVSWSRWQTARDCHETFFRLHAAGELARYRLDDRVLKDYERFSINAMCWLGSDLAEAAKRFESDDEAWVTEIVPREAERPCCIVGDSLVAHFAYGPQRAGLELACDALAGYKALAPHEHHDAIERLIPKRPEPSLGKRMRNLLATWRPSNYVARSA